MNTTDCQRQIILACFIYKIAFDNRIDCKNYCNNYMYNCEQAGQVSVFVAYNINAKLDMMYTDTTKYSDLLLLDNCQKLFAGNLPRGPKTVAK